MKVQAIILITALTVTGMAAGAQNKKWTLQECIDYAVENNISLRQSRNAHLSGLEDTYQAKAAMFPSLNASASQGAPTDPSPKAVTAPWSVRMSTAHPKPQAGQETTALTPA